MRETDTLRLRICPGQTAFLLALRDRILHVPRIAGSAAASAGLTAALVLTGRGNEAAAPLAILCGCITALFAALLIYTLRTRPLLEKQIRAEEAQGGTVLCTTQALVPSFRSRLSWKAVRGQYWCGDRYVLYIDDKTYRSLWCFAVDEENFDSLYALAEFLNGRKVRLARIRVRGQKNAEAEEKKGE